MNDKLLLTFNAGSATVKIGVFRLEGERLERIGKAVLDFSDIPLRLHLNGGATTFELALTRHPEDDLSEVMEEVLEKIGHQFDLSLLVAAGHRIVHGGEAFKGPTLMNADTMEKVRALTELAPLHQPQALRLIRALQRLRPELRQTGSFDTTFHTTQDALARRFALPRALHDRGLKRYGFHGLSYSYVVRTLSKVAPELAAAKVVIAHLGSGASLCAVENGRSRDTSMGFSTLDGIPMATRPGWLDAGVLLHLLGPMGMSISDLEDLLYHRSGLLGVSGLSGDTRQLLRADLSGAQEAIDLFALRISGEVCRLANTMGGIDGLIFTAGIGENQPEIRRRVADRLLWLGIKLDGDANRQNAPCISKLASRIAVYVIPTDEEQMIAEECLSLLHAYD